MNKKIVGVIILIVVAVLALCALRTVKNTERPVVKIGYANVLGSLPVFVAKENKYFEEQGLKPEFVAVTTGNQLVEGLLRGDLDVVPFSAVVPLLNAELTDSGKVKIFSLGAMTVENPFDSVVVKNDSPIKSISDLVGKKIGVFPGSTATAFLKAYLTLKKIDITKIEFIQIPPQNHITALEAKSVDALYTYEPNVTISLQKAGARRIMGSVYAELLENSPAAGGMIRTSLVNSDKGIVKKIVKAIDNANTFINASENNLKVREIAMKSFNLEQIVADNVSIPHMSDSGSINKTVFTQFVDMLVSLGELKSKPDLSNIFYK